MRCRFLCPKRNGGGGAEAFGGECIAQPAGVRRRCVGERKCAGSACRCAGAGLTHFRRCRSRVRVLLYIRPPRHRREIKAMGPKGAPANAHRPHGLRRRPRRLWPPAAAVIHNGLSTEKLSTSLLTALCKTFSPSRLRTRIYNISFARRLLPRVSASLRGRGRAVVTPCPAPPSAGWGRAKAKADAPSHSAPHFPCLRPRTCPPKIEPLPAYGPNHCAQRRNCTGNPRRSPCVLPVPARLPPRPRRLNGHPASAGGRENDRMAHRRTTTPTHRTQRGNDTCTIRVP